MSEVHILAIHASTTRGYYRALISRRAFEDVIRREDRSVIKGKVVNQARVQREVRREREREGRLEHEGQNSSSRMRRDAQRFLDDTETVDDNSRVRRD